MTFDIGIGLLLGVLTERLSDLPYGLCLLFGVVACLLPDLDFVLPLLFGKKEIISKNHREGLHYPLLFIPAAGLIGYLIHPAVGLCFLLGTLIHFLHDSIGYGWGVMWLFPFNNNAYHFLYRVPLATEKNMPKQKIYRWDKQQRQELLKKYGDPNWIRNIYFRPTWVAIIEHSVLVIGIIGAVLLKP